MPAQRPLTTTKQARALLKKHGMLALTGAAVPSLAFAIAGGPIQGSWWAHEHGGLIFRIASELEDAEDVLVVKLVDGKVTFVHAALWPALYRIVSDPDWRAARIAQLNAAGRALLDRVEAERRVRPEDRAAKDAIEKSLLARSCQVHTDGGKHATELTSWRHWSTPDLRARAAKMSMTDATAKLAAHANGALLAVQDPPSRKRRS